MTGFQLTDAHLVNLYLGVAVILLITVFAGLARVLRGPTPADRMMAAQLFGTTGVAILLLLAEALSAPALHDVALTFALLGAVAMVAFVRRAWTPSEGAVEGVVEGALEGALEGTGVGTGVGARGQTHGGRQ